MSQSAPTPDTATADLLPHELHGPLEALRRYGFPLAAGALVAIVVMLGVMFYRGRGEATRNDALMLMSSARSFEDLERVVSDYAETPAAPMALLKLAHAYFSAGNYALAREKYAAFSAGYAQHAFAPVAELGSVHCLEALGQLEVALRGFEAFATSNPNHYLVAEAALGQARCLQQLGRLTQARIVYEQFIATHPQSAWTRHMEQLLQGVNRDIAAGRDGIAQIQVAAPKPASDNFFAPVGVTTPQP